MVEITKPMQTSRHQNAQSNNATTMYILFIEYVTDAIIAITNATTLVIFIKNMVPLSL